MNEEEKETYMKYCKYDKEPKKVIMNLVGAIEKQQAEIEKKDKIIDLMALDIYGMQIECNRYFKDTEEVKQYFERKIEQ